MHCNDGSTRMTWSGIPTQRAQAQCATSISSAAERGNEIKSVAVMRVATRAWWRKARSVEILGTSRMALVRSKVNVAISDMDGRAGRFGVSTMVNGG